MNSIQVSPLSQWREFCKKGLLAYQKDADGNAIFFPRVVSPKTGSADLTWCTSKGLGTVYSVTTMFSKGQPTGNVALVDLDEGFRMLSTIRMNSAELPVVGLRVRVKFEPVAGDDSAPIPVFVDARERS